MDDEELPKGETKLIYVNGEWVFAVTSPASGFGTTGADIWMDPKEHYWICRVGEELAVHDLPEPPPHSGSV